MIVMDLAMFPLDKGASLSHHVTAIVRVIEQSGLPFQLGPMGTAVEGEWDELNTLLKNCYQTLEPISDRFYLTIKMDYRKGATNRLQSKVKSIERNLKPEPVS